jgi:hypothetical protein
MSFLNPQQPNQYKSRMHFQTFFALTAVTLSAAFPNPFLSSIARVANGHDVHLMPRGTHYSTLSSLAVEEKADVPSIAPNMSSDSDIMRSLKEARLLKDNNFFQSTTNDTSLNNYMLGFKNNNNHWNMRYEFIQQYHLNETDVKAILRWVGIIEYRKEILEAARKVPIYAGPCIRIVNLRPDNIAALDNALLQSGKHVEVQDMGAHKGIMAASPAGMIWEGRESKRHQLMIWSKTARWITTAKYHFRDEAEVIWLKAFNPQFRVIGKELKEGEEYGRFNLTIYYLVEEIVIKIE